MTFPSHPKVKQIASGWAAYGGGIGVHAATKDGVLKEYKEMVKLYKELSKRPANGAEPKQKEAKSKLR